MMLKNTLRYDKDIRYFRRMGIIVSTKFILPTFYRDNRDIGGRSSGQRGINKNSKHFSFYVMYDVSWWFIYKIWG